MTIKLAKWPSAILPLAMASAAPGIVLVHAARYGVVHEADEGTSAHLFQLLMVLQVPADVFLLAKWLPRDPGWTLQVLGLQAIVVLAAFAGVFFLT